MRIPYYQVDAFAAETFRGNPADVCVLERWLSDSVLQKIAAENNLSETAFIVKESDYFHLRWFTPVMEVDLCGHATLAPAFVLFSELHHQEPSVRFNTRSGWLTATRRDKVIELDFPARPAVGCEVPEQLLRALGGKAREVLKSRDYLVVFASEMEVAALTPRMDLLETVDSLGVIATAPGSDADFVSRFFAPRAGIPEDPATGSSHSTLIPYWAERLGKAELFGRQISKRGGEMFCRLIGDRVGIGGQAVIYGRGEIDVPAS